MLIGKWWCLDYDNSGYLLSNSLGRETKTIGDVWTQDAYIGNIGNSFV